jgi:hypothetical protein
MSAAKLGFAAKAYRLTTGSRAAWPASGAPSNLTEVSNVRDVGISLEKGEADTTTRATTGWEVVTGTLKKGPLEFEMVYDPSDSHMTALLTAFLTNITVAMAFLDADKVTVGTQGIWADWEVLKFEKMEPLNGAQMVKVGIKPGYSAIPPAWVTVGA